MKWQQNTYKDGWIKIIGSLFTSHFIEAMGREESIFQMLLRPSYYTALISGAVIAYVLWEFVSRVTVWLDQYCDWLAKTFQRILLQFSFCVCVAATLLYLLTFLQMKLLFHQDILETEFLVNEFPAACILIVLVNMYYITYYFYKKAVIQQTSNIATVDSHVVALQSLPTEARSKIILVTRGSNTLPLPVEQIAYIYKSGDFAYIKTITDDNYLVSQSLDELETILDNRLFFRANRQTLVCWKSCRSFSPSEFGKLQLQLQPTHKTPVIVSQKKAPAFREWLLKHN